MSSAIEIDGEILHPIREAAELVSYSRDYITRLAREEKIVATNLGRQWFISLDSLKAYVEASAMEQSIRKKQLSEERKREREIREVSEKQNNLHLKRAESLHIRAVVAASLVLSFGLLGGFVTQQFISYSEPQQAQVSSANEIYTSQFSQQSANISSVVEAGLSKELESSRREISKLGDASDGILLMPSQGASDAKKMFSDDVMIMTLSDGTKVVVQVDGEGNVSGNRVPFVTIPVEPKDI